MMLQFYSGQKLSPKRKLEKRKEGKKLTIENKALPHKFQIQKINQNIIRLILGIDEHLDLTPKEMARHLKVTFFPQTQKISRGLKTFSIKLENSFKKSGVEVIPFKHALVSVKDKMKIKKGIGVIGVGKYNTGNLPVDYTCSFTENPIVTILDKPRELKENLSYQEYMDMGIKLFTEHMSNIIVCIGKENFIIFSFNGHSLFYKLDENFDKVILNNLIPKMATRVSPPKLREFRIRRLKQTFLEDIKIYPYIEDFIESGPLFAQTELFPPLKKIDSFPFRNDFYKWIASLHLDERKGMSYGFIARQLSIKLEKLIPLKIACKFFKLSENLIRNEKFFINDKKLYILIEINDKPYILRVPSVWVLMSRSGSEKTKLDPTRDILKIGLINSQMVMEVPPNVVLEEDYRPSFDTRIILSHCVANAIIGSILATFKKNAIFPRILEKNGLALVHWHGNILPEFIPRGWYIYGENNLPVLCSSPQAAIYAFQGKINAVQQSLSSDVEYLGDLHIEPQHGINISWETLKGLAYYLFSSSFISKLISNNLLNHDNL